MGTPFFADFAKAVCVINLQRARTDDEGNDIVDYNIRGGSIQPFVDTPGVYFVTMDEEIKRDEMFAVCGVRFGNGDLQFNASECQLVWSTENQFVLATIASDDSVPYNNLEVFCIVGRIVGGNKGSMQINSVIVGGGG